jgi:hypothetical protein
MQFIKYSSTEYRNYFIKKFKNVNIIFYILFILMIFFISCSGDEENPVINEEKTDQQIVKVDSWNKLKFPPKTKTFLAYQSKLIFAGTEEGKFYVSNDNCVTWIEASDAIKYRGPIKSIDFLELDNSTNKLEGHAIACSDAAIYYSNDGGKTWYESLAFQTGYGPVEANVVKFLKKINDQASEISVFIGGKFYLYSDYVKMKKQFNIYTRTVSTKSLNFLLDHWDTTSIGYSKGNVKSIFCYPETYSLSTSKVTYLQCLSGFSDSVSNYYYAGNLNTYSKDGIVMSLGTTNSVLSFCKNPNGEKFIGTKNGLYLQFYGTGSSLEKYGLNNLEVRFLEINSVNVLYAGTSNGLFCSTDLGVTWKDIGPSMNTPIENMSLTKDGYLYIKNSNGEFFNIKEEMTSITGLYMTPLMYPEKNMTGVELSPIFKWCGWVNESPSYWLQISKNPEFTSPLVFDLKFIKGLSYKVNELQTKTTYYWRVRSETIKYQTDWSYVWSFTTI